MARLMVMLLVWNTAAVMVIGKNIHKVIGHNISEAQVYYRILEKLSITQQFDVDEMVRAAGSSGIKKMKMRSQGTKPFYSTSFADRVSVAGLSDHSHVLRELGSDQIAVVLNGVEFRTSENDYQAQKRAHRKRGRGKTEDVTLPPVPRQVTRSHSVNGQIIELRKWFSAWKKQNRKIRDYRKYFKPLFCYLEGAWTKSKQTDRIKAPFRSKFRSIDASSWGNLADMVRFIDYSGWDAIDYPYEPTHLLKRSRDHKAYVAQWSYGIFCHPIEGDLPLKHLQLVDDLKTRMINGHKTIYAYANSPAARFRFKSQSYLDFLMSHIPGRDGYGRTIRDKPFKQNLYLGNSRWVRLNNANYHRWYRMGSKQGRNIYHRSSSDSNVFMARTTDPSIVEIETQRCLDTSKPNVKNHCEKVKQRWTYAIPLEIVYMTPLQKWNPYNIKYYTGRYFKAPANTITKSINGRLNGRNPKKAFNGVNNVNYYLTPSAFFKKHRFVYVRDRKRKIKRVVASGFYTILPNIPGVGNVRTRFPIIPVHDEDSAVWREINALKEIVINPRKFHSMYYNLNGGLCHLK
ncbi:hypothetical protein LSH36_3g24014 [Paralvinella palmiformis]|uniref:Uncharacterized protein n=1 Tax=Paralvinella palmiformis TaxID=53620 RepID=A0AAD9KG03_9ANNE|nr:hypothetical protein LSH36_3g24014 [Paralvinella palmiformis]